MKRAAAVTVWLLLAACPPAQPTPVDDTPSLLGGAATIKNATGKAYTFPAPPLDLDQRDTFSLGDHFFNRNWVTAPASTSGFDGLGPTFNATSCSACHLLDGRASPPKKEGDAILGLLFRVSIPGSDVHGGPNPVPNYGDQLEPRSILHVEPEVVLGISYVEMPGTFSDGEPYSLRKPVYEFTSPAYGEFPADMMVSPRIATSMIGLGLLESISEETILSREDPDDADGDGISGHANRVWDVAQQTTVVGRFGWKANQPNIRQQTAGALLGDMGITSRLFPNDNCPGSQTACQAAPNGSDVDAGEPEIDDMKFDSIVDYAHGLAVPARRAWTDAEVLHGEELFTQAGCNACHLTEVQGGSLNRFHNLSNQKLKPFTDLLLHDLGDGLADGRPDYTATGTEWRTAPLWGLGLMELVNGHQNLLHDGRARGPAEAILWHGGEAQRSRDAFVNMSKAERDALVRFLQDL